MFCILTSLCQEKLLEELCDREPLATEWRYGAWPGALDVFGDENTVSGGPDRRQEGRRDRVEVKRGELLDRLGPEAAQKRLLTTDQVPEVRRQTKQSVQVDRINKRLIHLGTEQLTCDASLIA